MSRAEKQLTRLQIARETVEEVPVPAAGVHPQPPDALTRPDHTHRLIDSTLRRSAPKFECYPPGGFRRMRAMTDQLGFSLTQLQYFVVSAELGNISEAAERLCTSQSTVSSAVRRLERHLGVQLLLRHHARGVSLTPSGRHLLHEAHLLLRQARSLKAQSDSLASDITGPLDVGFFYPIAPFLRPLVCRLIEKRHGVLQLNVHEESAEEILKFLRAGRCEMIVTYDFLAEESVFHPLVELPVHALVAEDGPGADDGRVSLGELVARPLVTLDSPPLLRHFEKLCVDAGVAMPPVIRTTTQETMRGLVAAGFGFALMYQRASPVTTFDGRRVRAVDIVDDLASSSLGVGIMPGSAMSGRAKAFLSVLRSVISVGYDVTPQPGPDDTPASLWTR
ncbi:LysR family transcriptional regulator [Streptomyces sp. NPDC059605]|uniref:LysR family transcriptional regulator n=2 Tax=Streptomyces TaxID=1883 RepID=UPI0036CBE6EB